MQYKLYYHSDCKSCNGIINDLEYEIAEYKIDMVDIKLMPPSEWKTILHKEDNKISLSQLYADGKFICQSHDIIDYFARLRME